MIALWADLRYFGYLGDFGFLVFSLTWQNGTQGCVCGFLTDPQKECTCTPLQIQRYRSEWFRAVWTRIDIDSR